MDTATPMPGRMTGAAGLAAGLANAPKAPPTTLVIFGGGGDLTKRLLMPSLYNLQAAQLLDDGFQVIGVDRNDVAEDAYRDGLTETMHGFVGSKGNEFEASKLDETAWGAIRDRLHYLKGDFGEDSTYQELKGSGSGELRVLPGGGGRGSLGR